MAFETPQYNLTDYLKWTRDGKLQLPDFQRGYKWEDERIRQLVITVLRGHPMGAVMLLETGNDQVRFKPKPISGSDAPSGSEPRWLLLDGQQRLTSLTQAMSGDGVVKTSDARGKSVERRYFVDIRLALEGEDRIDEAVISMPADGKERENFGRDIVRDVSTPELQQAEGLFPVNLVLSYYDAQDWLFNLEDRELHKRFSQEVLAPANMYQIPAISLDRTTSKAAVATVFEKVNTGGVPLTVFELLTSTFAGDADYFRDHGKDFRLKDDWDELEKDFARFEVLSGVKSTEFLQAVTLLTTRERNRASTSSRPPAVSAKREDVLKLELVDYLRWRDAVRDGFLWAGRFLNDLCVFDTRFLPYQTQIVPLAVLRVVLGGTAEAHGVVERIRQWYWSGVLGELYGAATETRFVRDIEQVAPWAVGETDVVPGTVAEASFSESRFFSLRTRNAAAYKGLYALQVAQGAMDWVKDHRFDLQTHKDLATDIHHVFPQAWSKNNDIEPERFDSIVNKTPLSAETNRAIGGGAPSQYLTRVEKNSHQSAERVDALLRTHGLDPAAMRADDFETHFRHRREFLITVIESAMKKPVQRDVEVGEVNEDPADFEDQWEVERGE
ncbi:GmrSD restriction endonuclease domain-containing protein [Brevibacterium litoralis]|uniref:GmrSD restriction endonuclease domain-containing protein n=1 Tax=Brevibacterium litoralis TaxID=3138935 RepID=UPI0032EE0A21